QNKNLLNVPQFESPQTNAVSLFSSCQVGGDHIYNRGSWDPRTKLDPQVIFIQEKGSEGFYSTPFLANPGSLGQFARIRDDLTWISDTLPFLSDGSLNLTETNPFSTTAGRPLRSVGELGLVFDPALAPNVPTTERATRRAGARTLTIGQAD